MVTSRSVLAGLCLVLAMLSAAACAQLNEVMTSRDLDCGEVPEDICVKLADDIVRQWTPAMAASDGPIVLVMVKPVDCENLGRTYPPKTPCWEVEASAGGTGSVKSTYYQKVNGRLFDWDGRVVDN